MSYTTVRALGLKSVREPLLAMVLLRGASIRTGGIASSSQIVEVGRMGKVGWQQICYQNGEVFFHVLRKHESWNPKFGIFARTPIANYT